MLTKWRAHGERRVTSDEWAVLSAARFCIGYLERQFAFFGSLRFFLRALHNHDTINALRTHSFLLLVGRRQM